MKGTVSALCAGLALSWVAVAGAQGYGQPGSQASDQAKSHASKKSSEVRLIGCLVEGTTPGSFVLNNVENETGEKGSKSNMGEQTGTAGTTGQSERSEHMNMSFDLVSGGRKIDLKKYVGQKVEIRGKVEPEQGGESMPREGTSGQVSGTEGTSGQSEAMSGQSGSMSGSQSSTGPVTHRVKVTSVKTLGSSCQ